MHDLPADLRQLEVTTLHTRDYIAELEASFSSDSDSDSVAARAEMREALGERSRAG